MRLSRIGFWFDGVLFSRSSLKARFSMDYLYLQTSFGRVRVYDSKQNDKPPLVMVPDGPCFIEHFDKLIALSSEKYRVVVFDLPGFGGSYPTSLYDHSFARGAEVVAQVLEQLELKNVSLAFSCVNGYYALKVIESSLDRLKQIVLMQTPHFEAMRPWADRAIPWPLKIPLMGQIFSVLQKWAIPKIWFRLALPKESHHVAGYTAVSHKVFENGGCNCLASVVQGMALEKTESLNEALKKITIPIKAIWGLKDHSHKFTESKSILSLVPQAALHVWEDCGHFPNLEHPERFLDVVGS